VTTLAGPGLRALPCVLLAAAVFAAVPPPDSLRTGLALFVLIGSLWMTQALRGLMLNLVCIGAVAAGAFLAFG